MQDGNANNEIESIILARYTQTIADETVEASFLTNFDQLIAIVTTKLYTKIEDLNLILEF